MIFNEFTAVVNADPKMKYDLIATEKSYASLN